MTAPTTTTRWNSIVEMFADATVGESYNQGRLITEETPSGNVALIAYGWAKLAEYDETEETVTLFYGHKNAESHTLKCWLTRLAEKVSDRRDVEISPESPTVRAPNDGVEYIGSYIGSGDDSPVEEKARRSVAESLSHLRSVL